MNETPVESSDEAGGAAAPGMRCDFCGRTVARVRRIALDTGYDRLQVRHAERYACPDCSAKKERQRLGGRRA